MTQVPRSDSGQARSAGEIAAAVLGVALVGCALAATERWFDRHFLPSFFLPRRWYVLMLTVVRVAMAALGVWLVFVARPRVGRLVVRTPARTVHIAIACVLAIGASEAALRSIHLRPAEWLMPGEEPRRQPDAQLGWTFVPARAGRAEVGGRAIEYAFDAAGYRVRRVDEPVDPDRPTILCIGESVMFGEGLTWDESVPAQVGAMMGLQSANLAVHGYSTDQGYLRLQAELPHFRQPVAVVSLFMTALFGRNLDDDRPHLGPGLVWLPAQSHARLASLAKLLVPYRRNETVERGVAMTRDVLRAIADRSRERGALPLIVVPQLGREEAGDQTVRHRVLDEAQVPYVLVEIDDAWRLPWDRHPNARAARVIAAAITARLHSATDARGQAAEVGSMRQTGPPR
jgi:hypothetical protein